MAATFENASILKEDEDNFPTEGRLVSNIGGPLELPAIIYGAGTFSNQYNTDDHIASALPLRTVRLALRYGIRAIDTSVYYGPSEIVLGNVLDALRDEFPRSSYQLMTKCGRFGVDTFDYSPNAIRRSVTQSLERLKTHYLDTVYLHDVEFVAEAVLANVTGNHESALNTDLAAYGLGEGDEAKIRGVGDQKILDAVAELRSLQQEGLVKNVGITGYPLPTLLRLAILVLHTPPFKPLDILLSYSHFCLQNDTFLKFIPQLYERAKIKQVIPASPLSMGLLTYAPPPWHPAPPDLRQAVVDAASSWEGDFPNLAVGYAMRQARSASPPLPLVVGFSSPREVHECVKVWRQITNPELSQDRQKEGERKAREVFSKAGYLDWSWMSP